MQISMRLAFVQEQQAERAVEALRDHLPSHATVLRDGRPVQIEARELVPDDIVVIVEGDRISADARLLDSAVEVEVAALTGESTPVERAAGAGDGVLLVAPFPLIVWGADEALR
jgi:P-type E1-E2 ATPase